MPFQIVQNDITDLPVDVLVFATKLQQKAEGGVNREKYDAATNTKQEQPFVFTEKLEYGMVYATPAVEVPKRYIFHTAPPFFSGGFDGEYELLKACYLNCLNLALRLRCSSIAFPLLGSGGQGFPDTVAFRLASQWIQDFLRHEDLEIFLMLNDRITTIPNADINNQIEQYLARSMPDSQKSHQRENVASEVLPPVIVSNVSFSSIQPRQTSDSKIGSIEERLGRLQTSFSPALLKLIDKSGKTDPEIYKKANLTRQHFSKIRSNPTYIPSKMTVLALAVALELNLTQTQDLLSRAGYTLSKSLKADQIVEYFLHKKTYDIYQINEVLFYYDLPLLGARVN